MKSINILIVIVCVTIFISGCGYELSKKDRSQDVGLTPTQERKAELLKDIDDEYSNPEHHYNLGKLYQDQGQWTEAEYQYNLALQFDPVHRPAQAGMVKVLLEAGDEAKSKMLADIFLNQISNDAAGALKLGYAFQKQLLDDYALLCYNSALNQAPESYAVNRQVGYYWLSKNDKVQAKNYLIQSFRLNPNQPDVSGELGRLGVEVTVPRTKSKNTKKIDKIIDKPAEEND